MIFAFADITPKNINDLVHAVGRKICTLEYDFLPASPANHPAGSMRPESFGSFVKHLGTRRIGTTLKPKPAP